MLYRGKGGLQYALSPSPIANGGEGDIYDINGKPNIVAKMYKPSKINAEKERKLVKMIDYTPNQKMLAQIAWPQDVLYDSSGQFAGFVMPKMSVNEDLNVIYEYGASAKYPDISWENRILIAENLCAVLHSIHDWGHVCGDLNPKNISVDPNTGYVVFLDTDSYHIQDGVNIYRCDVGIPQYLPAEMQMKMRGGNTLATVKLPTFSQDTDNFALAIHIFQLLMNGVHPFACTIIPSQSSVPAPQPVDNIIRGEFPFMQNIPGVKIPPYAPKITILPKNIQNLFERAFIDGHSSPGKRPRPEDWHTALRDLRKNLKQCKQVNHHQYFKSLSDCPWCKADYSFNQVLNQSSAITQTTFQPPSPPSVRPPSLYGATPSIPAPAPRVKTAQFTAGLLGLVVGASLFAFIYTPWVYSGARELKLISIIGLPIFTYVAVYGSFRSPDGFIRLLVAILIAPMFLHKICTDLVIYGTTFGQQQRIFDSPLKAIIAIGAIIGLQAGYRIGGNVISGTTRNNVIILGIALFVVVVGPLSLFFSLPDFATRLSPRLQGRSVIQLKEPPKETLEKLLEITRKTEGGGKTEESRKAEVAHKGKVNAVSESFMNWSEAKAFCQQQGRRLPRINNSDSWTWGDHNKVTIDGIGTRGDPWPPGLPTNVDTFWTGTEFTGYPGQSWVVHRRSVGGNIDITSRIQSNSIHTVCVR